MAGKYKLQRALGEGGMGRVFLGRHEITGRPVAIKVVATADAVTRKRLLGEARAMGRLSHPNVVGVLDMGEWEGAVFLVMEYVHGKTLSRLMKGEPIPPEQALQLLLPACSGVAAAHQAGILHRDLKPENLFVCTDRDGEPITTKVLDFGVAKALDEADGSVTDTGVIIGTPRYMAPEQIERDRTLDERTDVYALGLILYELLVGKLPYASGSLRSIMLEIVKGDFAAPHHLETSIPVDLSKIVLGALALDPDDRPSSVEAFARSLEPFSGGQRFEAPLDVHTFDNGPESALPETIRPRRVGGDDTTAPSAKGGPSPAPTLEAPADASLESGGGEVTDTMPSTARPGVVHAREQAISTTTPAGTELEEAPVGGAPRARWIAVAAALAGAALWWVAASEPGSSDVPEAVRTAPSSLPAATAPEGARSVAPKASTAPSAPPAPIAPSAPSPATSAKAAPLPAVRRPRAMPKPRVPVSSPAKPPTTVAPPVPAPVVAPRPKTDNRDPWAEAP